MAIGLNDYRPLATLFVGEPYDPAGNPLETYGVAAPGTYGGGGTRPVFASTHGYVATVGDGGLISQWQTFPAVMQTAMSISIQGHDGQRPTHTTERTVAPLVFSDPDRKLAHWERYLWNQRPITLYRGEADWNGKPIGQWQKIQGLLAEKIERRGDELLVYVTDQHALLDQEINSTKYRGYGNALRFDGVNDYATAGGKGDGDLGSGGAVIDLILKFGGETSGTHQVYMIKRGGIGVGTVGGYSIRHNKSAGTNGRLIAELDDGTNYTQVAIDYDLDNAPRDSFHRLSLHLDRINGLATLYLDGQASSSADISSFGSIVSTSRELMFGATFTPSHFADMDLAWASIRYGDYTGQQVLDEGMGLPSMNAATDLWLDFNDGTGSIATAYPAWRRNYLVADGVDDEISVSDNADISPSSITVEAFVRVDLGSTVQKIGYKGSAYQLDVSSSDEFRGYGHDGTAFQGPAKSTAQSLHSVQNVAATIDENADEIKIWIGDQVVDTLSSAGLSGGLNDSADPLRILGRGSNFMQGSLFGFRIWDHARSASQRAVDIVTSDRSGESGLSLQLELNDGSGTTATDSSGNGNDGTISGSAIWGSNNLAITGATWVGSLEGTAELKGRRKPSSIGMLYIQPGVLVDRQRHVYQVSTRALVSLTPRAGGNADFTLVADSTDVYSQTLSAGEYQTDLSRGLVRFNADPGETVTFDFQTEGYDGANTQSRSGDILSVLANEAGNLWTDPLFLISVDGSVFEPTAVWTRKVVGLPIFDDTPITYRQALAEIAETEDLQMSVSPFASSPAIDFQLRPHFQEPRVSFADRDPGIQGIGTPVDSAASVPVKQVRVGYRRHLRVLEEDELAGALSDEERDRYRQEWRYYTSDIDEEVAAAYEDKAVVLTVHTLLQDEADAKTHAERLLLTRKRPSLIRTIEIEDPDLSSLPAFGTDGALRSDEVPNLAGGLPSWCVGVSVDESEGGRSAELSFLVPSAIDPRLALRQRFGRHRIAVQIGVYRYFRDFFATVGIDNLGFVGGTYTAGFGDTQEYLEGIPFLTMAQANTLTGPGAGTAGVGQFDINVSPPYTIVALVQNDDHATDDKYLVDSPGSVKLYRDASSNIWRLTSTTDLDLSDTATDDEFIVVMGYVDGANSRIRTNFGETTGTMTNADLASPTLWGNDANTVLYGGIHEFLVITGEMTEDDFRFLNWYAKAVLGSTHTVAGAMQ